MVSAFIMINTMKINEDDFIRQIRKEKEVKEIYQVTGVYNVVIRVEESDIGALKTTVVDKIRKMNNIKSTMTLIVNEKIRSKTFPGKIFKIAT